MKKGVKAYNTLFQPYKDTEDPSSEDLIPDL